jgi:hypothetical protein
MSTQHTPGPWTTFPKARLTVWSESTGCVVAGSIGARTPDECDANAALIAAAPDLLARLESLLFDLDAIGYADEDDEVSGAECVDVCSQHIESIRAAIAKATGA